MGVGEAQAEEGEQEGMGEKQERRETRERGRGEREVGDQGWEVMEGRHRGCRRRGSLGEGDCRDTRLAKREKLDTALAFSLNPMAQEPIKG